jgi:hypothetical protein
MFYDFNRHKKAAAEPEVKVPDCRPLRASMQKSLASIPEKLKMPALILLISLAGVGFFRLIADGITASELPGFSANQPGLFYRKSPQPFDSYLDSLQRAYILDSLSDSSPKR